jgi:hypothetical protein
MEKPSFKLVFGFALGTLALALVLNVTGFDFPGGRTLDFVLTQDGAIDLYSQYSPADIETHRWLTSRVDMVFPFIYGCFFYMAAKRYASTPWVYLLVFWVAVGMIFDFTENVAQLNILNGDDDFALKTVFTRAKIVFLAMPVVFSCWHFLRDCMLDKKRRNA